MTPRNSTMRPTLNDEAVNNWKLAEYLATTTFDTKHTPLFVGWWAGPSVPPTKCQHMFSAWLSFSTLASIKKPACFSFPGPQLQHYQLQRETTPKTLTAFNLPTKTKPIPKTQHQETMCIIVTHEYTCDHVLQLTKGSWCVPPCYVTYQIKRENFVCPDRCMPIQDQFRYR